MRILFYVYPQPCRIRTNIGRFRQIVGNASLDTRARETDISKTESNLTNVIPKPILL